MESLQSPSVKPSIKIIFWFAICLFAALPGYGQVASPTFTPQTPSTVFSPSDGLLGFNVQVNCATAGAVIRYTINGVEPTVTDATIASGGSIIINRNLVLKAKAWVGASVSNTTKETYYVAHAVGAGDLSSYAIDFNGSIFAWGKNAQGRLGIGNTTNYSTPQPSNGLSINALDIYGGAEDSQATPAAHAIMLKEDGTVWTAGSGANGRLGNNGTTTQTSWVQVVTDAASPPYQVLANVRAVVLELLLAML
jgi:hypothetical protein